MTTATLNETQHSRRSSGDACRVVYKCEVGVDNCTEISLTLITTEILESKSLYRKYI